MSVVVEFKEGWMRYLMDSHKHRTAEGSARYIENLVPIDCTFPTDVTTVIDMHIWIDQTRPMVKMSDEKSTTWRDCFERRMQVDEQVLETIVAAGEVKIVLNGGESGGMGY